MRSALSAPSHSQKPHVSYTHLSLNIPKGELLQLLQGWRSETALGKTWEAKLCRPYWTECVGNIAARPTAFHNISGTVLLFVFGSRQGNKDKEQVDFPKYKNSPEIKPPLCFSTVSDTRAPKKQDDLRALHHSGCTVKPPGEQATPLRRAFPRRRVFPSGPRKLFSSSSDF